MVWLHYGSTLVAAALTLLPSERGKWTLKQITALDGLVTPGGLDPRLAENEGPFWACCCEACP